MDELGSYGSVLTSYEGVGEILYKNGLTAAEVHFDARQLLTGDIIVGCMADAHEFLSWNITQLTGMTSEGKVFRTVGVHDVHHTRVSPPSSSLHFRCTKFEIVDSIPEIGRQVFPWPLEASLANFIVDPKWHNSRPGDMELKLEDYIVLIVFAGDYCLKYESLRNTGAILETAKAFIKRTDGGAIEEGEIEPLLHRLATPLSLASSNMVSWLTYTIRATDGKSLRTVYRRAIARPFSGNGVNFGLYTDAGRIATAWNAATSLPLDREDIGRCVHQYLDACARNLFFETRSLAAATLLDVLAGKYATAKNNTVVIDENVWSQYLLPKAQNTLQEVLNQFPQTVNDPPPEGATVSRAQAVEAVNRLDKGKHQALKAKLAGLWRRSFNSQLNSLLRDLKVECESSFLDRAKQSRNKLVHEGRFVGENREERLQENAQLLWVSYAILLRLIDKDVAIPNFHAIRDEWFLREPHREDDLI